MTSAFANAGRIVLAALALAATLGAETPSSRDLPRARAWFTSQHVVRCFPFLADDLFRTHETATSATGAAPTPFTIGGGAFDRWHAVAFATAARFTARDDVYRYRDSRGEQGDVRLAMTSWARNGAIVAVAWYERAGSVADALYEDSIAGYLRVGAPHGATPPFASGDAARALETAAGETFAGALHKVPQSHRVARCGVTAVVLATNNSLEDTIALIFDAQNRIVVAEERISL